MSDSERSGLEAQDPSLGQVMAVKTESSIVNQAILAALEAKRPADLITVVAAEPDGEPPLGTKMLVEREGAEFGGFGIEALDGAVRADAQRILSEGKSQVVTYEISGPRGDLKIDAFHELLEPQPQLVILGAGHIAVPLASFAHLLGFEVVVIDDRDKYANRERFPEADEVIAADFGETVQKLRITPFTYLAIITRGHTFDEEALRVLLRQEPAYIGVIGSRRRVETVLRKLAGEGYERERLSAVYAPIGLDIGSETPEEIALSIIAEIIAARRGGTGHSLSRQGRPMAF
ncbi:MAG TPA: XdhC/CoxI family protein [Chloroflexota bacterium]